MKHDCRDRRQRHDEVRAEPVVFLALVEQDLERTHRQRQQRDADVIDTHTGSPARAEIRRILHHPEHQKQRQQTDGKIDVEDPAPGVIVGQPSAQRRANRGRHDGGDSVEREGQPALLGREGVRQNGLRHRLKPAAAGALNHAEQNQHRQAGSDAAEQRGDGEQEDAQQEEPLAAKCRRQPSADRKHDRVRHQIGRQHPGAFVVAGAQVPRQVRQTPRWRCWCRAPP